MIDIEPFSFYLLCVCDQRLSLIQIPSHTYIYIPIPNVMIDSQFLLPTTSRLITTEGSLCITDAQEYVGLPYQNWLEGTVDRVWKSSKISQR